MRSVLLLALVGLFFLPASGVPGLGAYRRLSEVIENGAHPVIFFAIAQLLLAVFSGRVRRHHVWTFTTCALLGGLTELLQLSIGRDGSVGDFVNDLIGAVGALSLQAWREASAGSTTPTIRAGLLVVGTFCALLVAMPFCWAGVAYFHRTANLPVLWRSDSFMDRYFSNAIETDRYTGMSLDEPWPDWSRFTACEVGVRNGDTRAVSITVQIRHGSGDGEAGRYEQSFDLQPGSSLVATIALDRLRPAWNLKDIRKVAVFRRHGAAPYGRLEVNEIRLRR